MATSDHRGSIALQRTLADATSCDQLQDEEQGHMQFASVQSGNLVNDTDRKAVNILRSVRSWRKIRCRLYDVNYRSSLDS